MEQPGEPPGLFGALQDLLNDTDTLLKGGDALALPPALPLLDASVLDNLPPTAPTATAEDEESLAPAAPDTPTAVLLAPLPTLGAGDALPEDVSPPPGYLAVARKTVTRRAAAAPYTLPAGAAGAAAAAFRLLLPAHADEAPRQRPTLCVREVMAVDMASAWLGRLSAAALEDGQPQTPAGQSCLRWVFPGAGPDGHHLLLEAQVSVWVHGEAHCVLCYRPRADRCGCQVRVLQTSRKPLPRQSNRPTGALAAGAGALVDSGLRHGGGHVTLRVQLMKGDKCAACKAKRESMAQCRSCQGTGRSPDSPGIFLPTLPRSGGNGTQPAVVVLQFILSACTAAGQPLSKLEVFTGFAHLRGKTFKQTEAAAIAPAMAAVAPAPLPAPTMPLPAFSSPSSLISASPAPAAGSGGFLFGTSCAFADTPLPPVVKAEACEPPELGLSDYLQHAEHMLHAGQLHPTVAAAVANLLSVAYAGVPAAQDSLLAFFSSLAQLGSAGMPAANDGASANDAGDNAGDDADPMAHLG